jgi:hypothetical protein
MAEHQPTKWKLFCIVVGGNTSFSVKISSDETVDDLKKAIKKEKEHDFAGFDADRLTLFKVDVPALDLSKALEQIPKLDLSSATMNPVLKLSRYYSTTPSEEMIHILIHTPEIRK